MAERDVLVCGAGPVGAAFALFLVARGVPRERVLLVDARDAAAAAADPRLIAISHGSALLLERLGAWAAVAPHATPIETIHVSHRGRFGRTVIEAADHRVPALGHVIRHGDLGRALDDALRRHAIAVVRPLRISAVVPASDEALRVTVATDAAPDLPDTRFVVHAEGGLFASQARRALHRDYGQTALTSFVTVADGLDERLRHTAFERFTEHGPIALLPARVPDASGRPRRGHALVWCCAPDDATRRLGWDDARFVAGLQAAFGDRLGRFVTADARHAYPLGLNALDRTARATSAGTAEFAIGNAAQTLHPVAGQGLNLGLRDAFALATLLGDALAGSNRTASIDAPALAARHDAQRRFDRTTTVRLTDWMPRLFADPLLPVAWGRGATLALLDAVTPLRAVFARQMMDGRR